MEKPNSLPFTTFPIPHEAYREAAEYLVYLNSVSPIVTGSAIKILTGEGFRGRDTLFQSRILRKVAKEYIEITGVN